MSWSSKLDQIEDDFKSGRLLLSSALILTANTMRNVAADTVLFWLNRELTGYEKEDIQSMEIQGYAPMLTPRNLNGTWGIEFPSGAFVEKGVTEVLLSHGIPEIEAALDMLFDISIFEKGDYHLMINTIDQSPCRLALLRLPLPEQDASFMFNAFGLLNLYFGVGQLLCKMIQTLKECYTGEDLIKLNVRS